MTITAQNARARRALQPRGFSKQKLFLTLLRSFTEQKHEKRRTSCIILNANANFEKLSNQFWDAWQHTFKDFSILTSDRTHINNIKGDGAC